MKYINKITFALAFALLFGLQSCVDNSINEDPTLIPDVSVDLLLPSAQFAMTMVHGDDHARTTSMWMQQSSGTDRQYDVIERYSITETDVDNVWATTYADCLNDCKVIIDKATADGTIPHYAGIAKVVQAATLGITTDLFNDIPWSNALQGADNLKPTFDSQENVYASIFTLLDSAMADFNSENAGIMPGSDDMIFGGNIDMWKKYINLLKARYSIHKSEVSSSAYSEALSALDAGTFTSSADDAKLTFGDAQANGNPWWLFNAFEREGYMSAGGTLVDLMASLGDPRMAAYFTVDANGEFSGAAPGSSEDGKSVTGPGFSGPNTPIYLATYVEAKFIEAEAALQTGDAARAATAHNEAVTASVEMFGDGDTSAYLAEQASEDSGSISLETIMTHKYIALYTQVEVYNDWRRKGIPSLNIAANATLTQIPTRMPYPQAERLYNGANLPSAGLTDKVWWDQ